MLATVMVAILAFGALFAAMAIGVIFANKPIKGSCGGLNALGMKRDCEICGGSPDDCRDTRGPDSPSKG